jgi:hypothetical protein
MYVRMYICIYELMYKFVCVVVFPKIANTILNIQESLYAQITWNSLHIACVFVGITDTGDRAVSGVSMRLLACWDCGFETHRGLDVLLL